MTETQHETPTRTAVLKVSYLLTVTVVAFAVPALSLTEPGRWFVIPGLAGIQAVILLTCQVGLRDVARVALRLKWLFVFLIGMYALLPPENPSANDVLMDWHVPGVGWSLSINLSGLEKAALMCLQIVTVLLASAVVRLTGTGRDFVDGLHAFRLPPLFVHALDIFWTVMPFFRIQRIKPDITTILIGIVAFVGIGGIWLSLWAVTVASGCGCSRRACSPSTANNSASHSWDFLVQNSSEIRPDTKSSVLAIGQFPPRELSRISLSDALSPPC